MKKLALLDNFLDTMKVGGMRTRHLLKEKSPEIIFTVSTFCIVKGVVSAYKAAPDWKNSLDDHKKRVEIIEKLYESGELSEVEESKEMVKEGWTLTEEFLRKNMKCVLYTGLGIAGYGTSFHILKDREKKWKNFAADLTLGLLAYRGRVAEHVGADKEFDLFHNIKREVVEEEYVDEKGKKRKRAVEKVVSGGQVGGDDNSFWFGVGDVHHQGIKEYDLNFIIETEIMFNKILVGRGHGGKITREEIEQYCKWIQFDRYPFNAHNMGWIYDANRTDYEFYRDPITGKYTKLPRIIKFTCSREFMDPDDPTNETWVELNCYPIAPILKQMQEDLLDEVRRNHAGHYIPDTNN